MSNLQYPDEIVAEVKGLYAIGISPKRIAQRTGLDSSTVAKWCYGWMRKSVLPAINADAALVPIFQKIRYFEIEKVQIPSDSAGELRPQET